MHTKKTLPIFGGVFLYCINEVAELRGFSINSYFKKISFIGFAFLSSLLTGAAQFACLAILTRILIVEDFSRISFILGLFPIYLLLVEMGIQAELIRLFAQKKNEHLFSAAVYLRILGACLGIGAVVIHTLLGDSSVTTIVGAAVFLLALVPSALMITIEAEGYAENKLFKVCFFRVVRLVAILVFTFILYSLGMSSTAPLDLAQYSASFLTFPILIFLSALIFAKKLKYEFVYFSHAWKLFKDKYNLFINLVMWWLVLVLFSILLLRVVGDANLENYTVAQTLVVPAALLCQVVTNYLISVRHKIDGYFSRKLSSGFLTIIVCCGLYGLFMTHPFIIQLIFKSVSVEQVVHNFWPLFGGALLIAANSLVTMEGQARNLKSLSYTGPAISLIILCIAFLLPRTIITGQTVIYVYFTMLLISFVGSAVHLSFNKTIER